jgi:hypothetical protein
MAAASGLAKVVSDTAPPPPFKVALPVAAPFDVEHVAVMEQPVEDGSGQDLVARKDLRPVLSSSSSKCPATGTRIRTHFFWYKRNQCC